MRKSTNKGSFTDKKGGMVTIFTGLYNQRYYVWVQWIGSREQFDRKPCFASNCEQSVYIKPLDTDTQWAKHGWYFACQMWRPSGNQT
jgi:hypothetical protein